MADLAANSSIETRPRAGRDAGQIADGVTLYAGALVGFEGGYINHWADGANDVFLGIVLGGDDRADDGVLIGETSDTLPPEVRIDTSGVVLVGLDSVNGAAAVTQQGDLVYCSTSNTDDMDTQASGHTHPIGFILRWKSATDVDVQLFTPAEMLAQATA